MFTIHKVEIKLSDNSSVFNVNITNIEDRSEEMISFPAYTEKDADDFIDRFKMLFSETICSTIEEI